MPNFNFRHSHRLRIPRITIDSSRTMRLLFSIRIIRELANKFALFFLPVFLFQLGQSTHVLGDWGLSHLQSGIVLMSLYLAGARLSALLLAFPAGNFIRKYGFSAGLMLSHLLYAVMLVSFRVSMDNSSWLLVAMLADGVNSFLMWGCFNTLFSKGAKEARMGQDLGFVQLLLNLTWMIAPALSGVAIFLIGYEFLFSIGLVLTGILIVLSALLKAPHERDKISFKELAFWVNERRFVKLGVSIAGKAIHDLAIFVWPLYVFLLLGNTEKVGFLYSLSFLLSMILSLFIGVKLDHQQKKRPFFVSGGIISLLWALRAQVFSFWSIAVVDALDKITGNFHWLFFDRVLLNRGKGREAFSYFVYREMIISVTIVIFWSFFALMFLVFPFEWKGLFALAAVGVMMSLLVSRKQD